MSQPPRSNQRLSAWARQRGLSMDEVLEAIRPSLESLLARLRAFGARLPPEAAPPPEQPRERGR